MSALHIKQTIKFYLHPDESIETDYMINDLKFPVIIIPHKPDWIKIRVKLMELKQIPKEQRENLLRDLLIQNYVLEDVTFSMEENDILYSENDIPRSSNLENFHSELTAVVQGAATFLREITPKYKSDVKQLFK